MINIEFPSELLATYKNFFVNCDDRCVLQRAYGGYEVLYRPLTDGWLAKHLQGDLTLGFPALSKDGLCKWAVWDSDTESGDLFKIESVLEKLRLHALREGSRPGRDGHLWMFFDRPILASSLRRFNLEICAHANVPPNDIEFFPKQDEFKKSPNPVRGPLGINRKPEAAGVRGLFDGARTTDVLDQLVWLTNQPLNPAHHIESMVKKIIARERFIETYMPPRKNERADIGTVDPVYVFADLDPEQMGTYYVCDCPDCGERRAYFYEDGCMLTCNRVNNCGLRISISEYLKRVSK